jgi:hypothetical protein
VWLFNSVEKNFQYLINLSCNIFILSFGIEIQSVQKNMSVSDGSFDVDLNGKMWGLNATPSNLIEAHSRRSGNVNTGKNISLSKTNTPPTGKIADAASKSTTEQATREQAKRDQAKRDHAIGEQATREQATREQSPMSLFYAMQYWSTAFHGAGSDADSSSKSKHNAVRSGDGHHIALDVEHGKGQNAGLYGTSGISKTVPLKLFTYAYILLFALTIVGTLVFMNYLDMAVRILKLILPCFTVLWALQGYVIFCLYPPYAAVATAYVMLFALLVISNIYLEIMPSISFVTEGLTYCCFVTTFLLSLMYVQLCLNHGFSRITAILTALSFMVSGLLIMGYDFGSSTQITTAQPIRDRGRCIVLQIYTVLALSVYYSATYRNLSLHLHVQ